ncbi:hypothetical protein GpartN1_g7269.t1 [Galdieria partita]|uniref:Protein kinase domain-containing protein n=1 Tax=Galdieria partita TaxID=83374 RepID=A0A9C7Q2W9_9RHOD|nr:hypothetical protein GpartN1_g7269.t1 [Galdieria partita]
MFLWSSKKWSFIPWSELQLGNNRNFQSEVSLVPALWQGTPVMIKFVEKNVDTESERMLRNEIKMVKTLSHPSIPEYYGWGETEKELYLVMELLKGASLEKMRSTLKGQYAKVSELFYRCVEAVEYLHSRNIIHRDLKPSNFFVVKGGSSIKVLDFGVAKSFRANTTLTGDTGSYWYMAPEVISDGYVENEKQYDMKADIYSMGIILNELLTGVMPYAEYLEETPWQIANTVLRHNLRPQLVSDCPCLTEFQSLIQACWATDPESRPNISQVRNEMLQILKKMDIDVKDHNKGSCSLQ